MNEGIGAGEFLLAGGGDANDSWLIDERLECVRTTTTHAEVPIGPKAAR